MSYLVVVFGVLGQSISILFDWVSGVNGILVGFGWIWLDAGAGILGLWTEMNCPSCAMEF